MTYYLYKAFTHETQHVGMYSFYYLLAIQKVLCLVFKCCTMNNNYHISGPVLMRLAFYLLCTFFVFPWNKDWLFHSLSTRGHHHSKFLQTPSPPKTGHKASPVSCKALQLLQTQLYQDEKHLLCLHSFLEQLMPARQSVQWEEARRGQKRGCEQRVW